MQSLSLWYLEEILPEATAKAVLNEMTKILSKLPAPALEHA